MRYTVLLFFAVFITFLPSESFGQAKAEIFETNFGKIRAVIVGVSTYKNLPNPLQYADDDAMLVADFFNKHPSTDSVILLLNEEATADRFRSSINAMIKKSKVGDAVYVYFAGHGNVQQDIEEGFLLFTNVTPDDTDYFADDAFKLSDLKNFGYLCGKRKIKFVLITDACRSGTILSDKGTNQTLAYLNSEWDHTAKLISCQPNQVSNEYPDLGSGHGIFTYYLIEALSGKAEDQNKNQTLELFEIKAYVSRPVMDRTSFTQIPAWSGNDLYQLLSKEESPIIMAKSDAKNDKGVARKSGKRSVGTKAEAQLNTTTIKSFYQLLDSGKLIPWKNKSSISLKGSRILKAHQDITYSLAIDPMRNKVAVGSNKDRAIKMYDVSGGQLKEEGKILSAEGSRFLVYSRNGSQLISSSWSGTVSVYDVATKSKTKTIQAGHGGNTLAISNDGKTLATGSTDGMIRFWSFPELSPIKEFKAHQDEVTRISFDRSDSLLFSTSKDKSFKAWTLHTNKENVLGRHESFINALALSMDGKYAYTADELGFIKKWDLISKADPLKAKLPGYVMNINDLSLSDDGSQLLVTGKQYSMSILSADKLEVLSQFVKTSRGITKAFLDQSKQKIYAATYGGEIVEIELDGNKPDATSLYYASISRNPSLAEIANLAQADLTAALLTKGNDLIKPFIAGSTILPSPENIEYGIQCLQAAMQVSENSEVIIHEVANRLLFLEGMKILQSNQQQEIDQAIQKFNAVLQNEPRATYPLNALAIAYRKKNQLDKARQQLSEASRQIATWTEPVANLGVNAMNAGNGDLARKYFQKIIDLEPDQSKGYRLMGELETHIGNNVTALDYFNRAISKDKKDPILACDVALIDFKRENFQEAERKLKMIMTEYPATSLSYQYLGNLYLTFFLRHDRSQKNLFQSFNNLTLAQIADEANPENSFLLAKLFSSIGEFCTNEQAAQFMADLPILSDWKNLVFDKAISYIDQAISKSPFEWRYLTEKAVITNRFKGLAAAKDILFQDKLITGSLKDLSWAVFYEKINQLDASENYFKKAAAKDIPSLDFPEYLAELISKQKNGHDLKGWGKLLEETKSSPLLVAQANSADENRISVLLSKAISLDPHYVPATTAKNTTEGKSWTIPTIDGSNVAGVPISKHASMSTTSSGKYLVSASGDILIQLPYSNVKPIPDYNMLMVESNNKWGMISSEGDTLLPITHEKIELINKSLIVTQEKQKGVFSPGTAKWMVKPRFEDIAIHSDFIAVKLNGKWGALDATGKSLVPIAYESIGEATRKLRKVIEAKRQSHIFYYTLDGNCLNCN